jgi:hypothetical protein
VDEIGKAEDSVMADEAATGDVLREDGPAARAGSGFDPTPYFRQLRGRGGQDYLDVKWRLLWLRREHPDAEIVTEHVQIDPTLAIFKATVTIPTGGKATGYGSETAADFADFIEKAETKAIGRALNALGYGAQFGERNGEEGELSAVAGAAMTRHTEPGVRPAPAFPPVAPAASAAGMPVDAAEAVEAPAAPIDFVAGRDRAAGQRAAAPARPDAASGRTRAATPRPEPAASAEPAALSGDEEPELAEYSWSAFWPWARGLGLNGPGPVEGLIGRPTAGLTPAELRDLILAARNDA